MAPGKSIPAPQNPQKRPSVQHARGALGLRQWRSPFALHIVAGYECFAHLPALPTVHTFLELCHRHRDCAHGGPTMIGLTVHVVLYSAQATALARWLAASSCNNSP